MRKQHSQFTAIPFLHSLRQQNLRCRHDRSLHHFFIEESINPPLIGPLPPIGPVGGIEPAIGAELHIRRQNLPHILLPILHREARAVRLHRKTPQPAVGDAALEIAQQKMTVKRFRHPGAGIKSAAGRPVADMGDRRSHVHLVGVFFHRHDIFHQQRAGRFGFGDVLIPHAPTAVGSFDDVEPLGRVTVVGVVVAGIQIAVIVEAEFLRIAQAVGENFQVRAVRVAAQHTAHVGIDQLLSLFGGDVETAIATREIELAIRPETQAVQVMAFKAVPHAVTGRHDFSLIAHAGLFVVAQHPQVRHVAEIDIPLPLQHAGGDAVFERVKSIGPDDGLIASPAAGTVFQQSDAVRVLRQFLPAIRPMPLDHRAAVRHHPAGQILVDPVVDVANIQNPAAAKTIGLDHPDAPARIDAHRHRIDQLRLGGPGGDLQIRRLLKMRDRLLGFIESRRHFGIISRGRVDVGCPVDGLRHRIADGSYRQECRQRKEKEPVGAGCKWIASIQIGIHRLAYLRGDKMERQDFFRGRFVSILTAPSF